MWRNLGSVLMFLCKNALIRMYFLCGQMEMARGVSDGAAEARGEKTCPVEELGTTVEQGILTNNGEAVAAVTIQNQSASENMPADVLENSISKRAAEKTAQNFQKVLSLNHLWISIYHSFSRLARGPAN
ncbi:hypothetical protein Goari_005245, partial [Gossypium aridum]|nr:hypothetical protein [Gossypium aridum]